MLGQRWGVGDAEVERRYACDDFVTAPALEAWRGVDVAAPPEQVWPWVTQIRVAPYSYDWVDNLGRRSPRSLLGLPEPVVGEPFTASTRLLLKIVMETSRPVAALVTVGDLAMARRQLRTWKALAESAGATATDPP